MNYVVHKVIYRFAAGVLLASSPGLLPRTHFSALALNIIIFLRGAEKAWGRVLIIKKEVDEIRKEMSSSATNHDTDRDTPRSQTSVDSLKNGGSDNLQLVISNNCKLPLINQQGGIFKSQTTVPTHNCWLGLDPLLMQHLSPLEHHSADVEQEPPQPLLQCSTRHSLIIHHLLKKRALSVFPNNSDFSSHQSHSQVLYDPHICLWEGCGMTCDQLEDLVQHIKNVHIKKGKSCLWHSCIHRQKPFCDRYNLWIHIRIHSGEKPNKCTVS